MFFFHKPYNQFFQVGSDSFIGDFSLSQGIGGTTCTLIYFIMSTNVNKNRIIKSREEEEHDPDIAINSKTP